MSQTWSWERFTFIPYCAPTRNFSFFFFRLHQVTKLELAWKRLTLMHRIISSRRRKRACPKLIKKPWILGLMDWTPTHFSPSPNERRVTICPVVCVCVRIVSFGILCTLTIALSGGFSLILTVVYKFGSMQRSGGNCVWTAEHSKDFQIKSISSFKDLLGIK